jgi:outer membrane beta-barrel protein
MKKIMSCLSLFAVTCFGGTKDFYEFKWLDPEKKVFVLQDKLYENQKKFYINLGYGFQDLSQFQDTTNFHLALGYYFKEEWGVEVFTNIYRNKNNNAYEAVQNPQSGTPVLPFILRTKSIYGLMAIYSPFYAKLNTYNLIYYIDWSFGLGGAQVNGEDNYADFSAGNTTLQRGYESVSKTAITAKTQVAFHISDLWSFNIDFYNYWVKARQPNGGSEKYIRFHDWIFSLGMTF